MVHGQYSQYDGKLYGLMEIVTYANIKVDDILMFTHWGNGQFNIVIFDKSRVEKIIEETQAAIGKLNNQFLHQVYSL